MGTYTPLLKLYKPAVGEAKWFSKINNNFDIIDSVLNIHIKSFVDFVKYLYKQDAYKFITLVLDVDIEPPSALDTSIYDTITVENGKIDVQLYGNVIIQANGHTIKNIHLKIISNNTCIITDATLDDSYIECTGGTIILRNSIVTKFASGIVCLNDHSAIYVDNVVFENCRQAIYTNSLCNVHGSTFIDCGRGLLSDIIHDYSDKTVYTISSCTFVKCHTAVEFYGKTLTIDDTVIKGSVLAGINFISFMNDTSCIVRNSVIKNVISKGYRSSEYGGIILDIANSSITGVSATLDNTRIYACYGGGITKSTTIKYTLRILNNTMVDTNSCRDGNDDNVKNCDMDFSFYFDGVLTEMIGIYTYGVKAGDQLGTCSETLKGEEHIVSDNGAFKAKREGTVLKWVAR